MLAVYAVSPDMKSRCGESARCAMFVPALETLCTLFLNGKKRDRLETLAQCAEWSEFALEHFCSEI